MTLKNGENCAFILRGKEISVLLLPSVFFKKHVSIWK